MDIEILLVFVLVLVAGTYAANGGDCGLGQYYDGATPCVDCPSGTFQPSSTNTGGSSSCIPCSPGEYQSNAGSSSCIPCPLGYWMAATGASSCTKCTPSGKTTQTTGSTNASPCTECPAGTEEDDGECDDCPMHYYQDTPGSTSCTECPDGRVTSTTGSTHRRDCEECPTGTYETTRVCVACIKGEYQHRTGQTTCKECKYGKTTAGTGSDSKSDCIYEDCFNFFEDDKCDTFAEEGHCTDPSIKNLKSWSFFMDRNCRKACGFSPCAP